MLVKKVVVNLSISPHELELLYAGEAKNAIAKDLDGRRVLFPASILRQFVLHNGVQGIFEIEFSEDNRFKNIHRLK